MNQARTWRRSSYSSGSATQNCVEVAWRKSSYTGGSATQDCVEVALGPHQVGVRDSKNAPGPTLEFPPASWRAFLGGERIM
jgi:uncharacterized protein DUF397